MADEPIDTDRRRWLSRSGVRAAGLVAAFAGVALAIGGAYTWYAVNRLDYFVARDLRGLSTLSVQIQSEIERQQEAGLVTGPAGLVDLEPVVQPLFAQPFLSIFDVVLLSTADGKVLYQTVTTQTPPLPVPFPTDGSGGRRLTSGLIVTSLASLEKKKDGEWAPLTVADLSGASGRTTVRAMDDEYYLFTQPVHIVSETPTNVLVAGLVAKRTFRLQALAISDLILAIALAVALLLLCWYPFLRIALLPNRAPLKPVDVVLATLGALLGSAVVTIAIGDTIIYRQLCNLENEQLEKYGRRLRTDLQTNMLRSVRVTESIRDWARLNHVTGTIDHAERPISEKIPGIWQERDVWQNRTSRSFCGSTCRERRLRRVP